MKIFFKSFISPQGKLNRIEYIQRLIILNFIIAIIVLVIDPIFEEITTPIAVGILIVFWYILMSQRLNSMGKKMKWNWAVGMFIPIINIILVLRLFLTPPKLLVKN